MQLMAHEDILIHLLENTTSENLTKEQSNHFRHARQARNPSANF